MSEAMGYWNKIFAVGLRLQPFAPQWGTRLMSAASWRTSEPELHFLPSLADPKRLSLDIGANWGMYTAVLLPVSSGVISFEPDPGEAAKLRRSFPKARVEECGLGAADSVAMLRQPLMANGTASKGWGTLSDRSFEHEKTVEVKVRRLDDFDLPPVGLIKIDVEGFENQVLDGGWNTIARDLPVMMIETDEPHALAERLAPLGYVASFWLDGASHPLADWHAGLEAWYGGPPNNFIFRVAN
jgi:FkbM family methyltransferase